jgi:PAS domain S-box-containing protein
METVASISFNRRPAILGNSMNITDVKLAQEKLRLSESLYRTIFESTGAATIIVEEGSEISLVNSEFEKLSCFRKADIENVKNWKEFVLPDDMRMLADLVQKAGPAVPVKLEFRVKSGSGQVRNVFLTIAAIPGTRRRIVSFIDITDRKLAEEAEKQRKQELTIKTRELEELNAAMRVLLKHRETEKGELEEKVLHNVKELVLPYLGMLKKSRLDSDGVEYIKSLEANLKEIVSPFIHQLSSKYLSLTHRELQVANLIKEGKSTKEIADIMHVCPGAIDLHRNHIRQKLGLVNKKVNLRSFLDSVK